MSNGGVSKPDRVFLTAEWRELAMLNYEVDSSALQNLIPAGTELDCWNGRVFVSLVGFLFRNTRVLGVRIPFHHSFEEVNLRFYVRRQVQKEVRRGVVFIREIVPRRAIATVARVFYNEKYVALRMSHRIGEDETGGKKVDYSWHSKARWNHMRLVAIGQPCFPVEGSEEQFITEHYWGYAAQRHGGCTEYRVKHPTWRVWQTSVAQFEGDMSAYYGHELGRIIAGSPRSAFVAEGSAVSVYKGRSIHGSGASPRSEDRR
jgi:uncharacterized protein YqjF (DUF2071 family)